ncbi:carboxypeptidase-like regulatory domain-containing protein [Candidatus Uabimicrobium amorphum]|uniref:Carboxypeptidase regulatory-like domain-containing protein n=1 Tax=Uabimicrobium amorphum TaxID=2596890 RepID=A0A5S9IJU3_UABAM|nr:carboxypeptidase-like regulatory domain-containing protein [Candidatus Uabimicrobium amorphum]BBM82851.1 hypothetical protein UABAM_01194 [Candidatus Uabimicrobium amorphum]
MLFYTMVPQKHIFIFIIGVLFSVACSYECYITVVDKNGHPVRGVKITHIGNNDRATFTDKQGRARVPGLSPPKSRYIRVEKNGYKTVEMYYPPSGYIVLQKL